MAVSNEVKCSVEKATAELKAAGACEVYLFGSGARGNLRIDSDLDFAVSGLPPALFYRLGARLSDLAGRTVDLIDLDINTPFTQYLREENELVRVG